MKRRTLIQAALAAALAPALARAQAYPAKAIRIVNPFSAGGGYVNMMMDEGEDTVRAAYRDSYARLAAVKRAYDPGNLFRVNQNIKPA